MRYAIAILVMFAAATVAQARNIDLVTLPPRAKVQLTIYNSEDLTLVKETRSITFKKGVNRLEFSWANTLIDPTSAYLRPLGHEKEIEVLDTTFPADRPQVLIWNVDSKFEGQVPVEVSYFTSGISWNADYVMVTDRDETKASFDGYVTVVNNSGEDYEEAEVRLVVGTINLVEKIQQLAQAPGQVEDEKLRGEKDRRNYAYKEALEKAEPDLLVAGSTYALVDAGVGQDAPEDHQGRPVGVLHLHRRGPADGQDRLVTADDLVPRARTCRSRSSTATAPTSTETGRCGSSSWPMTKSTRWAIRPCRTA